MKFSRVIVTPVMFVTIFFVSHDISAEMLDLGGRKIEIVDGTITTAIATEALNYANNLYSRGSYGGTVGTLSKLIKNYRGSKLPDAYYLKGKAFFMQEEYKSSVYTFLLLYDQYRSSDIVSSGDLVDTVHKAVKKLKLNLQESKNATINDHLDGLLRFTALYQNLTGKYLSDVDSYLEENYTRNLSLDNESFGTNRGTIERKGNTYFKFSSSSSKPPSSYQLLYDEYNIFRSNCHDKSDKIFWEWFYGGLMRNLMYRATSPEMEYINAPIERGTVQRNTCNGGVSYDYFPIKSYRIINQKYVSMYVNDKIIEVNVDLYREIKKSKSQSAITFKWEKYKVELDYGNSRSISVRTANNSYYLKDDFSIGPVTANFLPLKELIITKHGNVYKWVGLNRSTDNL